MKSLAETLRDFVRTDGRAGQIAIVAVAGSSPREVGARMVVRHDGRFSGTIGGGALEWQALGDMQRMLARSATTRGVERAFALGPELGQCCGGRVTLRFDVFEAADLPGLNALADDAARNDRRTPLVLYGAGHVGRALVLALAPLPFRIDWIDPRPDAFPEAVPGNVSMAMPVDVLAPLAELRQPGLVLAMSHSHALDLALADAALRNPSARFVGVIGSETKRARFVSRLRAGGLAEAALERFVCPIGERSITSKEPAVIAAGVAVQLLKAREAIAAESHSTTNEMGRIHAQTG